MLEHKMCDKECQSPQLHVDGYCAGCSTEGKEGLFAIANHRNPMNRAQRTRHFFALLQRGEEKDSPPNMKNPFVTDPRYQARMMQECMRGERAEGDSTLEAYAKFSSIFPPTVSDIVLAGRMQVATKSSAREVDRRKSRYVA